MSLILDEEGGEQDEHFSEENFLLDCAKYLH